MAQKNLEGCKLTANLCRENFAILQTHQSLLEVETEEYSITDFSESLEYYRPQIRELYHIV